MKISIIGLGWFGLALGKELKKSHTVCGTTRTLEKMKKIQPFVPDTYVLSEGEKLNPHLLNSDAFIINIPPSKDQLNWFQSWGLPSDKHIIFISSTSVYGQNQIDVDEDTFPIPDSENGHILFAEEEWMKSFPFYTIIRFGGLIGPDRHPGRYLAGKENLAGGNWPVNLIHQEDTVAFTQLVLEKKIIGEVFNLVHPFHPSRKDYYQQYCRDNNLIPPQFSDSYGIGKKVSSLKVEKIFQFKKTI
jgi:nucleoside-diphosphate-sugar epimerase